MDIVKVHDKYFETYLSEASIKERIKNIAAQLNKDYADKKPIFIPVLNGSFMFASDLLKEISIDAEISFVKFASYKGMQSAEIHTSLGLDIDIKDRDIVIIEDIVDTGKTLSHFLPTLLEKGAKSLKLVALLHKKEATLYPIQIDYLCFEIPNKFVVGYGLDYDGLGRNFKDIYQLKS